MPRSDHYLIRFCSCCRSSSVTRELSTLPAFLTPNVVKLLVDTYQLKPITTLEQDLAACLA